MTVITTDLTPIRPYKINVVTLGVGRRVDVLVEGKHSPRGAYWMRSDISTECSHPNQPNPFVAVYYETANMNAVPQSMKTVYNAASQGCTDNSLQLTEPFFPEESSNPTTVQTIDITLGSNVTAAQVWFMNNIFFKCIFHKSLAGHFCRPKTPCLLKLM